MLLGVCAHECAHFLLLHSLVGTYQAVKREFRNNAIAAITAGVNIVANGYAAGSGVQVDWENVNQYNFNLAKSAQVDAKRFRYRYSREQEVEVDIIAYRFLQHAGIGGRVFTDFLELIQELDKSEWFYTDESDHPTTKYRINWLNFLDDSNEP